jgi:hypothetical protein
MTARILPRGIKRSTLVVFAILGPCGSLLSAEKAFQRIEVFPAGEQVSAKGKILGPLGGNGTNTVTATLSVPYSAVWTAVKNVAASFDKVGGRPVAGIDEGAGRIQNGRISGDGLIGSTGGLTAAWADEFVTEVTKVAENSTRVSVTRRLVERGGIGGGDRWRNEASNGSIERWMITKVMDEIATPSGPSLGETPAAPLSTVTYLYKEDSKNYLDLNSDGSFRLVQLGKQYVGQYTIVGEELTLTINGRGIKSRMAGDSFVDQEGKEWVKKGATLPLAAATTDAAFTNTDIVKLIDAKLPDSVIISKILGSSCNFDVSTDGLIKLKQANASDSVVQAVVSCKR